MSEWVTFLAPLPPRELRTNRRTRVIGYRARLVREYQEAVWCAGDEAQFWMDISGLMSPRLQRSRIQVQMTVQRQPWEWAHVRLTWRHHRVGPDPDGALSSCKALIDVLHSRGARPHSDEPGRLCCIPEYQRLDSSEMGNR